MKIVLTHPFCWPYVRRGNERNLVELARYLTHRGHHVITISTGPGPRTVEVTETGKRILHAPPSLSLLTKIRLQTPQIFFFNSLQSLCSLDADIVHSWYFYDSLAASCAKLRKDHQTVLQINGLGTPGVSSFRWFPPEGLIQKEAVKRANQRIACSQFIARWVRELYGADAHVIPPPVNVEPCTVGVGSSNGRPVILSVADFNVRRKGVRVLVKAFKLIESKIPSAILRLVGDISPSVREEVLRDLPESLKSRIEILGLRNAKEVSCLYREACVTVLPSMWEPSGTVLLESLAAGTPVVATNHGGIPEFVTAGVGVLFEPKTDKEETMNADGLAEALIEGLALSGQAETRKNCRSQAERFSWSVLGPEIEKVYRAGYHP